MKDNTTLERPSKVTTAVYMLYLSLGFVAARGVLECSLPGGNSSEGFGMLGMLPIPAVTYYMIGKGKNWARITFLILFVLDILFLVIEPLRHPGSPAG